MQCEKGWVCVVGKGKAGKQDLELMLWLPVSALGTRETGFWLERKSGTERGLWSMFPIRVSAARQKGKGKTLHKQDLV